MVIVYKIGVEYPWIPAKCAACNTYGHAAYTCSKQKKKVWVPKNEGVLKKDGRGGEEKKIFYSFIKKHQKRLNCAKYK